MSHTVSHTVNGSLETKEGVLKSSRLKILIAINDLCVAGAQQQLLRQLKHFDIKHYDIQIVTLFSHDRCVSLIKKIPPGVPVHQFNFQGFLDYKEWIRLFIFLRKLKPTLVVSSLFFSNTVLRVLKLPLGYNIVAREHNTYTGKTFFQRLVDRILALWTSRIIAVSEEVAVFTAEQEGIPRKKFLVIENGIDISEMNIISSEEVVAVKKEYSIEEGERVALHVGRLVDQKNQELLIRGFVKFQRTSPQWKLIIVGGGVLKEKLLSTVSSLGAEGFVFLIGERLDVGRYYAMADCFVSTSCVEGMSNAHLEALAHGVPVLTTKTGGTGSMIQDGENGYIIPVYTEEAVSRTLLNFSKSDIAKMKSSALMSSKRFNIGETVEKYETLFDSYRT